MLTTIRISFLIIVSISVSKAQYLALQIGGANSVVPNLSYEQVFYDKKRTGKGVRLSAGGGYRPDVYVLSAGTAAFFGQSSNWEIGVDVVRMTYFKSEYRPTYQRIFPYAGIRFGDGNLRGFASIGPLWVGDFTNRVFVSSTNRSRWYMDFAIKGGISYRILSPRGSDKNSHKR